MVLLYLYQHLSTMTESILKLTDVAVFQKENLVLNDINLEIKKGEFIYLIGKTGSGKSSLFFKILNYYQTAL